MTSDERKEALRAALISLINEHIAQTKIHPEEAATVLAEEAHTALDHLPWKPHAQRAAFEHLIVAAACLKEGRVIPVPNFELMFETKTATDSEG